MKTPQYPETPRPQRRRPLVAYYCPVPPEHLGQEGVKFLASRARVQGHGAALEWRRVCLTCGRRGDHYGLLVCRDLEPATLALFRICFDCSRLAEDLEQLVRAALPAAQVAEP